MLNMTKVSKKRLELMDRVFLCQIGYTPSGFVRSVGKVFVFVFSRVWPCMMS